jgi:hypothetical protein
VDDEPSGLSLDEGAQTNSVCLECVRQIQFASCKMVQNVRQGCNRTQIERRPSCQFALLRGGGQPKHGVKFNLMRVDDGAG